ncbi:unnamed protein product [Caenorhabditis angaria]|uniref:ER membrane protein complex subunit 1 n=1 Tax=Caenorhabditis angaria TaxID=860376 RepID=A0A9P1MYR9_9PELO|nr:unnamed protein product [Caenorhabditis angaria]
MTRLIWLLWLTLISGSLAIFEDQVGKLDWRKELVGCPNNVVFDKVERGSDRIILTTDEDILSALSLNTGEIAWRRILEKRTNPSYTPVVSTSDQDYIYTVSDEGRSIRVFRKADGVLNWQYLLDEEKSEIADIITTSTNIFVTNSRKIAIFEKNRETPIGVHNLPAGVRFSKFVRSADEILNLVIRENSQSIDVRSVSPENVEVVRSIQGNVKNIEKCEIVGENLVCYHSDSLTVFNVQSGTSKDISTALTITQIGGNSKYLIVRSQSSVKIYGENLLEVAKIDGKYDAFSLSNDYLILASKGEIRVVSLQNGNVLFKTNLASSETRVSPRRIYASSTKDIELIVIGEDCKIEMIVIEIGKQAIIEWKREESLMRISAVEMVDLPLSESQQLIEDEFDEQQHNIISAFIRRIVVQIGQIRRWAIRSVEQLFAITATFSSKNGNGFSDFVKSVKQSASTSFSKDGPFERDLFNIRKLIIVSTLDGVIFGLDSAGGDILWRFYLGENFSPLKSEISGNSQLPLFVQRTTAHYQLNGQASVIFSDSVTSNGIIVSFNPITGEIVSREVLGGKIKRVSLLPNIDKSTHVHPLIILQTNGAIKYFPEIEEVQGSLHMLDVEKDNRIVGGLKINLAKKTIKKVWSGNLGLSQNDQIIAIKGKPYNQKVHSQGRVLIDRNVQYKYINPNLAAIAAINPTSQILTIILVDVVSGQIVHSASIGKAAGPVHFVHSENWLAYSYWSEKGRRTELGIIELYESSDSPSQKETFNSLIPTEHAPVVMTQAYIYANGVEAMSVSETEQGLTTRSILLALPCGNIHEVSKRILDATRPFEVTQAMREEMIIGYMPEIPIATEEMINYNQTIHRVRGIKAAPAGLESTSLVLAYGTDLFFTRLTPSGTFDILKDDFDHVLISLVLTALVVGSYVAKRWARANALAAQWA